MLGVEDDAPDWDVCGRGGADREEPRSPCTVLATPRLIPMRIFRSPPFKDRRDAGRRLADTLLRFKDEGPVVFGLPRGGVPVGYEISRVLQAPLDVFVSRKLGAPGQPEFGIGAVAAGGVRVLNAEVIRRLGITDEYVERITAREVAEVERRLRYFRGGRPETDVGGRTAILVDDGLATGVTARAAVEALRRRGPSRLVLAAPVCAAQTAEIFAPGSGRSRLPAISVGPRGHRPLVQGLRADHGRGGYRAAREGHGRARRTGKPTITGATGRWEKDVRPVQ